MQKKTLGHLYALFTILVWGSCFVLTKVMLTAYTPTQIIPLRMGLAYLTLWALRPRTLKLPWKDELMFILIGITGGSVYFFLQNTAAAHTSAANVSILVSMSPILTVLLAQLFSRKGEKLGKLVYIGALVAIVGVVLVVLNGTLSFHLSPLGDLLALAAALMWAVYSILVKKYTERYDNFLVTRRVFLWAFLTSLPLVLLTDGMPCFPSRKFWFPGCFWACSAMRYASPSGTSPSSVWAWWSPTTICTPPPLSPWWWAGCCWARESAG